MSSQIFKQPVPIELLYQLLDQICLKTIMDTSDPNIVFDENGISDYFHNFRNYHLIPPEI